MRKWLLILAGVVLAAAVLVPAALHFHAYRQRLARSRLIDQEHCDRIKPGMTRTEVEAVLGGPRGNFATGHVQYYEWHDGWLARDGRRWEHWCGDRGQIVVTFDGGAAAEGMAFEEVFDPFPPPSLAERVRRWLRRLRP